MKAAPKVLASGMVSEISPETGERGVEETHSSLGAALRVFWVACFLAVGGLTAVRVLDRSTSVEVPTGPLRAQDGSWALGPVQAVCRQALAAHGVDPETSTPLDYIPGQLFGENVSRPDRILTAWEVGEDRRRVTVYVDVDGPIARCKVSESK